MAVLMLSMPEDKYSFQIVIAQIKVAYSISFLVLWLYKAESQTCIQIHGSQFI